MSSEADEVPWDSSFWTWGFVLAIAPAALALVTPWFHAVPPRGVWIHGSDYGAWSVPWLGLLGPFFLVWVGAQWYGARSGWWQPPSLGDLRGTGRSLAYGFVIVRTSGPDRTPGSASEPTLRVGAAMGVAQGAVTLLLLGLNRLVFRPTYAVIHINGPGPDRRGHMLVHPAFGFWCVLLAACLYIASGLTGLVVSALRPEAAR